MTVQTNALFLQFTGEVGDEMGEEEAGEGGEVGEDDEEDEEGPRGLGLIKGVWICCRHVWFSHRDDDDDDDDDEDDEVESDE